MELTPEFLARIKEIKKSPLRFTHDAKYVNLSIDVLVDAINQQQAEIERLKAALETLEINNRYIGSECNAWHSRFNNAEYQLDQIRIKSRVETNLQGALDEIFHLAMDELQEEDYESNPVKELAKIKSQQQPEPPQEPIETRILRALVSSEGFVKYTELTSMVKLGGLLSTISPMIASGWIEQGGGYKITAAGRDYLAALEGVK